MVPKRVRGGAVMRAFVWVAIAMIAFVSTGVSAQTAPLPPLSAVFDDGCRYQWSAIEYWQRAECGYQVRVTGSWQGQLPDGAIVEAVIDGVWVVQILGGLDEQGLPWRIVDVTDPEGSWIIYRHWPGTGTAGWLRVQYEPGQTYIQTPLGVWLTEAEYWASVSYPGLVPPALPNLGAVGCTQTGIGWAADWNLDGQIDYRDNEYKCRTNE
jgi:hypothetical protein